MSSGNNSIYRNDSDFYYFIGSTAGSSGLTGSNSSGTFTMGNVVLAGNTQLNYVVWKVGDVKFLQLESASFSKDTNAGKVVSTTTLPAEFRPLSGSPEVLTSCLELAVGEAIYGFSLSTAGVLTIFKSQVASRNITANQSFTLSQATMTFI
jgi:hypothetical protein